MRFILILILLFMTSNAHAEKAVKQKSTGRLVYKESPDFETGKGIENAKKMYGYDEADLEEVEVTQADWNAEITQKAGTQKVEAITTNLPSWSEVNTSIDNISNLAEAKVVIKKLARVIYWLAKDKAE